MTLQKTTVSYSPLVGLQCLFRWLSMIVSKFRRRKAVKADTLFQQKLKLSFSKSGLEKRVDELRKYNGDLRVLSEQVKRLKKERNNLSLPRGAEKTIVHYQTVRKASQKLFDKLSSVWSCAAHLEHSANICLAEDDQNRTQVIPSNVCFNMAFTFPETRDSNTTRKPLRLTIESAFEQTEDSADPPVRPERTAIHTLTAALHTLDKNGKKVSFALPHATNASVTHQPSSSSAALENMPLDLCSVEDMCLYVQEHLQISTTSSACIGFLQKTRTFKHFVVLVSKFSTMLGAFDILERGPHGHENVPIWHPHSRQATAGEASSTSCVTIPLVIKPLVTQ